MRVSTEIALSKGKATQLNKLSNDKAFAANLEAIVGLYMSPPENAIALSCDIKSQIQALNRTQPGLPMKKGQSGHIDA